MKSIAALAVACLGAASALAQPRENENYVDSLSVKIADIRLEVSKIRDNYYVITPYGIAGNIGVYVGEDGIYLVDNMWAILSKRIKEILGSISAKPVKVIFNTHYHFDHTQGNKVFGGEKIPIIAHVNSRARMSERQVVPTYHNVVQKPYPAEGLPTTTFTDQTTVYEASESIELMYFKDAHTDGDVIVHFKNADIYHMGDIFVTYGLPHIDEKAGGDINGMIDALNVIIPRSNEKTRFIPGHGPVCTVKEVKEFRDLLVTVRDNVALLASQKKALAEIVRDTKAKVNKPDADRFMEQTYRAVVKRIK